MYPGSLSSIPAVVTHTIRMVRHTLTSIKTRRTTGTGTKDTTTGSGQVKATIARRAAGAAAIRAGGWAFMAVEFLIISSSGRCRAIIGITTLGERWTSGFRQIMTPMEDTGAFGFVS